MSNWKKRLLFSSFISFFWFKLTNKKETLKLLNYGQQGQIESTPGKTKGKQKRDGEWRVKQGGYINTIQNFEIA